MPSFRHGGWLVLWLLVGCADGPTSLLVTVSAPAGTAVATLELAISVEGADAGVARTVTPDGGVALPGTVLVRLPDVEANVTVGLRATTGDGIVLVRSAIIRSKPHARVELSLTLAEAMLDGGAPDGAADAAVSDGAMLDAAPSDGAPIDGALLDAATPDGSPDLAGAVLADDTFIRANQTSWGTASDGQPWQSDAASATYFSITGNQGVVAMGGLFSGHLVGLIGPTVGNVEVTVTGSLSTFANNNQLSAFSRFTDSGNYYRAGLNATTLFIDRDQAATHTTIGSANLTLLANTLYTIKFLTVGSTLQAKAWPAAQTEPAGWMVTITDATFTSGRIGAQAFFGSTASASNIYTRFHAVAR